MPGKSSALFRTLAFIIIFTAFFGCATSSLQMKVTPDLATTAPTVVTGRSPEGWTREFQFASWRVQPPRAPLDWNSTSSISIPPLPSNTELHVVFDRASVQFELASASENVVTAANCLAQGRCAGITETRGRLAETSDITRPGYPRVNCDFMGTQNDTLALRVTDYVSQRGAGDAEHSGHRWSIRSVNALQSRNSAFPIARLGYKILAD